jgi:hypothetical protein
MDTTIDFNMFENKKNSFCVDECVKSFTMEISNSEKSCIETCFKTMDSALKIAYELQGEK